MKFGVFLPNGSSGFIPPAGRPAGLPTVEHNGQISSEAEQQGFDFVPPMIKCRGFGDPVKPLLAGAARGRGGRT